MYRLIENFLENKLIKFGFYFAKEIAVHYYTDNAHQLRVSSDLPLCKIGEKPLRAASWQHGCWH